MVAQIIEYLILKVFFQSRAVQIMIDPRMLYGVQNSRMSMNTMVVISLGLAMTLNFCASTMLNYYVSWEHLV